MKEYNTDGHLGRAALRSGMDRKTASKYINVGKLPSELKMARHWRTRENPFEVDWQWVEQKLEKSPTLEAKTLFDELCRTFPERYQESQLRTLQRHVRQWRALRGPEQEVRFAQEHIPGEAAQTDFTWATELQVTIAGEVFLHMLCHFVLPFSNWQWATVCLSESYLALKRGVQAALWRLGHVPSNHQTDNSTAATWTRSKRTRFNLKYLELMAHYGMKPRTIAPGKKEQNGDIESQNGVLKRRLEQALLLRGSRDFPSVEVYEQWIFGEVERANALRKGKHDEEIKAMRKVPNRALPDFVEEAKQVTTWSTIRIDHNTYSVPSRLIGHKVSVRLSECNLEVWYAGKPQFSTERLRGRHGHTINYRHVIWSLVKKPGAFARYRFRQDLFPTLMFRRAYDSLSEKTPGLQSDLEYLRILHLAASTLQSDVELALECLFETSTPITANAVKDLVRPYEVKPPEMAAPIVDLTSYDALLSLKEAS